MNVKFILSFCKCHVVNELFCDLYEGKWGRMIEECHGVWGFEISLKKGVQLDNQEIFFMFIQIGIGAHRVSSHFFPTTILDVGGA